jgi:Icc-related predicted phosphoesterase
MSAHAVILVASDVHGRIPMLLRVALEYQRAHGAIDAILVSGDLGIWPEDTRLDSSTAKHSRTTPEELGFRAFRPRLGVQVPQREDAAEHLGKARTALTKVFAELEAPLFFVGGNHEDYAYLDRCRQESKSVPVPVDEAHRLRWIPHGAVVNVRTAVGDLRVAGLGGISAAEDGRNPAKYHPLAILDEDAALGLMDPTSSSHDILVTHDSSKDFVHEGHGASAIEALVAEVRPALHLCGHYHSRREPRAYPQPAGNPSAPTSLGVHMNTFIPDPQTLRLRPNSLGVIQVDAERALRFTFAEESFLRRFTARNWFKVD